MIYLVVLIVSIICTVSAEEIAHSRGRSALAYGLLGFFLGPIGVVAAAITPTDERVLDQRRFKTGQAVQCPACREIIHADARICRHCHHHLSEEELAAQAEHAAIAAEEAARARTRQIWITVAVLVALGIALVALCYFATR